MANAIAGIIWKLSAQVLLNLENENFETATQSQRLDILEELVSFLVHLVDRQIYDLTDAEKRALFITALVKDMARMLEDSRVDVQGEDAYKQAFYDKINARMGEFSDYSFSAEDGASFSMRCTLGAHIQAVMGSRDNKWIPDYIVGREAPEIENTLSRSLTNLVSFEDQNKCVSDTPD